MSAVRVFVNETPVDVPAGCCAADAVARFDPALGARLAAGGAYLTDARGLELPPDLPIGPGTIIRVIARRTGTDARA